MPRFSNSLNAAVDPWEDSGGSFDSCLQNLDGILKEMCFFDSADSNRGIKGCPKLSCRTCDVSNFYQYTRGCKSKCQSFRTIYCCAIKDWGYKIPMPIPVSFSRYRKLYAVICYWKWIAYAMWSCKRHLWFSSFFLQFVCWLTFVD